MRVKKNSRVGKVANKKLKAIELDLTVSRSLLVSTQKKCKTSQSGMPSNPGRLVFFALRMAKRTNSILNKGYLNLDHMSLFFFNG